MRYRFSVALLMVSIAYAGFALAQVSLKKNIEGIWFSDTTQNADFIIRSGYVDYYDVEQKYHYVLTGSRFVIVKPGDTNDTFRVSMSGRDTLFMDDAGGGNRVIYTRRDDRGR